MSATQPLLRPPFQPNPKSSSTAQPSQLLATAIHATPDIQPPPRPRSVKPRQDSAREDSTSEKATLSLIRRVLAPETSHGSDPRSSPKPVEDILPPLTSSNDFDVQLYAILAIIIKDFVNTWYTKITPDHAFVEEIIHIVAHCSRALEQRVRHVDIVELAVDELPGVLERHIRGNELMLSCENGINGG